MHVNLPRLLSATAALALVFTACGGEPSGGDELPGADPSTTVGDDGLRAPTPIRLTGGSGGDAAIGASESRAAADSSMIAPAYIDYQYVVTVDPSTLPTNSTGYVFDASVVATADDIAAVAAALGVAGEPISFDEGYGINWRVGPDDGTAPSIWLYDDALLSWNFNAGWADQAVTACAVSGSEPAVPVETVAEPIDDGDSKDGALEEPVEEPVDEMVEVDPPVCEEPEPPANVPSETAAVELANGYLTALGVDLSGVVYDNYVDQWGANVNVNEQIAGVTTRSWGFSFGGDAELLYAWGSLATPQPVGPYPLIDLDQAIARLESSEYGWGFGGGLVEPAVAVAEEPAVDIATDPPVAVGEGDVPVVSTPIVPEIVEVELVDVEADLWWAWDEDGSSWLLPAYRFVATDGGWFVVPAVTDEFLIQVPVETVPAETLPVETVPGETVPVDPPATTVPADTLEPLVGGPLPDFTDAAAAAGYTVRVVEIDGEPQAITMDLRDDRINVAIVTVDGVEIVIRASLDDGTLIGERDVAPPAAPPTTAPTGTEVAVSVVYEGVEFYPACGDEVLQHESGTWYSIQPEYEDWWALATETLRQEVVQSGFAPRVAPPGPGDDVGTLTVWEDGIARFVSDSGDVSAWLTQEELTYTWVC